MPHLPLLRSIVPRLMLSLSHVCGPNRGTSALPSWHSIQKWALHCPGLVDVFLAWAEGVTPKPGPVHMEGLQFTVERMLPWSREAKKEMGMGLPAALGS